MTDDASSHNPAHIAPSPPTSKVPLHRVSPEHKPMLSSDEVVREEPLEIRIRDTPIAVLMRTPGQDGELACGFVVTEGIVPARFVRFATHCRKVAPEIGRNIVHVLIPDHVKFDLERTTRNTTASSSCGVCGKASLASVFIEAPAPPRLSRPLNLSNIPAAFDALSAEQPIFDRTGGLHAAGLYNLRTGRLVTAREDIGRHNAVDKVIGRHVIKRNLPLKDHLLLVSGRVSFDITQKAQLAGIAAIAAVSAPSSLAIGLARENDMILIGFARGDRMNVYSGADQIVFDSPAPPSDAPE